MEMNEFIKIIQTSMTERMQGNPDLKDYSLELNCYRHPNGVTEHALILMKGKNVPCPSVRLNEYYERCLAGEALPGLLDEIYGRFTIPVLPKPIREAMRATENYATCRKYTVLRVLETERNRAYLEGLFHRPCEAGFTLMCEIRIPGLAGDEWRTPFHAELIEAFGVDPETVFQDALANTEALFPVSIAPLSGFMEGLERVPLDQAPDPLSDEEVYLVQTKGIRYGATGFFYPGVAAELARLLGGSYYAIPSSVYEVLIVPETISADKSGMKATLQQANREVVPDEEILSDRLLYYDAEEGVLKEA